MFQKKGIQVQIGGSDQYGNIVAGMDAVKYIAQNYTGIETRKDWIGKNGKFKETHAPMGLTVPLLTTASGEKFGKSAGNAIWLDKNLTSTFDLYGVGPLPVTQTTLWLLTRGSFYSARQMTT